MSKHIFEFYNHRVTATLYPNDGSVDGNVIDVVDSPCSVPLAIVNGFEFMLENNVRVLVMDGTEIKRIS